MSEVLLALRDITVRYGGATAVDHVSLQVHAGEAVFLVGSNGAGKSTLLRAISGLVRPAIGQITFAGEPITKLEPWDIVQRGIAHVPQNRRCFGDLSVEENLLMGGYTAPKASLPASLERVYELFPVLRDKRRQRAALLSGGQQQMVAVGRALMIETKLIMLDEPSLGLAPMLVTELGGSLRRISTEFGTSVLIVEQNVNLALSLGSRGYVLRAGRLVIEGTPEELRGQLREVYLGTAKPVTANPAARPQPAQD